MTRLGLQNRPRIRKLIIGVIGGTVILFGLALVILPGPAVLVVPLGLAILASEFAWARLLVKRGGAAWKSAQLWSRKRPEQPVHNSLGHDQN